MSGLQSEQERLVSNTERLNKLFAATGSSVDDYTDVLGSRLVTAIRNGTASSDQLKTAVELSLIHIFGWMPGKRWNLVLPMGFLPGQN